MNQPIRRVAMVSVHTSPLDQPGTGDAGGMNVYIAELARHLTLHDIEVDVFTRARSSDVPPSYELFPGVHVKSVMAGPYEGLRKEDLPGQLCAMTAGVMREEARRDEGWYDLIHSHYWLSGQVGWVATERWRVPLVHTMHTMAKVKNAALASGDSPEPMLRVIGEEQVVAAADRLIANTDVEAAELVEHYAADPAKVAVVNPGVDLELFSPGPGGVGAETRRAARARLGLPLDGEVLLFVGRIQPLKAPDLLVEATARVLRRRPSLRASLTTLVCGGPSGTGLERPEALHELAASLGVADVVQFRPPMAREGLVDMYRAADLLVVPSHSESFGLVAIEAQACGTPVVAADVGGLPTAVSDGVSGVLVPGHDPETWASVLCDLLDDPERRTRLSHGAVKHAQGFGWAETSHRVLEVYEEAVESRARDREAL